MGFSYFIRYCIHLWSSLFNTAMLRMIVSVRQDIFPPLPVQPVGRDYLGTNPGSHHHAQNLASSRPFLASPSVPNKSVRPPSSQEERNGVSSMTNGRAARGGREEDHQRSQRLALEYWMDPSCRRVKTNKKSGQGSPQILNVITEYKLTTVWPSLPTPVVTGVWIIYGLLAL